MSTPTLQRSGRCRDPGGARGSASAARLAGALWLAMALAGCTSQQLYGAGQAWQKTECQRLPDPDQRARCLKSSATSFDEYQRQAGALRARP